jgi:hypothetical protein
VANSKNYPILFIWIDSTEDETILTKSNPTRVKLLTTTLGVLLCAAVALEMFVY